MTLSSAAPESRTWAIAVLTAAVFHDDTLADLGAEATVESIAYLAGIAAGSLRTTADLGNACIHRLLADMGLCVAREVS